MATTSMSDVEALMWHVQRDPFLDPTFGSLTTLDRAPDVEHLRARLLRMARAHPRFAQRVVTPVGRLAPPMWVDADLDLDHHLQVVPAPAPGDRRAVLDLAARWVQEPLDHDRPLWRFLVLEGLADGGAAVLQKVHHTVVDGEGGLRASAELLDLSPEMPAVAPAAAPRGEPDPSPPAVVLGAAEQGLHRLASGARGAIGELAGVVRQPAQLGQAARATTVAARSAVDQLLTVDHARSPLWTSRTLRRRLDVVDLPLEELRTASRALDGTVNDAFVTVVGGAIGALHREAGHPVDELRMAMPVSTRRRGVPAGNAFVPTRLLVPVAEVDPRARFRAVHEVLGRARHDPVLAAAEPLAAVANLLPTALVARYVRDQARAVDFAASNVRGAPVPLWLAGARVLADHPIGPLTAAALNVSLLSLDGTCHLGLHSDAGAVADPARLVALVVEAHAELLDAVS